MEEDIYKKAELKLKLEKDVTGEKSDSDVDIANILKDALA